MCLALETDPVAVEQTPIMATNRATCWSVTINNPTPSDYEEMDMARSKGWKVEGQVEKGENGTPHRQLCVRTPQVRFSAMKKAFARGHIEVARNVVALRNYVAKEETKVSELPAQDNKYPSLAKTWELIFESFYTHDKDGWDECALYDGKVRLYRDQDQRELESDPLAWLGEATATLIKQGYFVEHHVCNPSVRSQWKNFHEEILIRAFNNIEARRKAAENKQSDRQTDDAFETKLNIPTINTQHHADAYTQQEGGLQEAGGSPSSEESFSDEEGTGSSSFGADSSCGESDCETSDCSQE